ncbi:hypothetical protein CNY67_07420 [Desulfovibrio sp. G11]|nr:hypothetical protein CNY67_07420 [Desulfovibrio sp. G11]
MRIGIISCDPAGKKRGKVSAASWVLTSPAWRIQFRPEGLRRTAINSKSPWRLSSEGLFKDLGARPVAGLGPESAVLRAAGIPHEAALAAQKDCRMAMQSRRPGQQVMQHTGRGSGRYQGQNSKAPRARCSGEL